jgi:hypothetical protein
MLAAAWVGAMFAYAAVWQASVQLGIATWWVGPRSQPTPAVVRMIPFLLALAVVLPIAYNRRHLHRVGLVGAMFAVVIALPDLNRSVGLAVVELAIAASLALVSAMSATGVARPAGSPVGSDPR